ncbi:MAG: hypothetical protein AAF678_07910 [Pseudomonadota bacterium]
MGPTKRLFFSLLCGWLAYVAPALAQTPVAGNYGLGAGLSQTSAIMPPQGTRLVENGWIFYNIDRFVDDDGNDLGVGGTEVRATRLAFRYVVPGVELLGAD